ncbi:LysE family protein [Burkholderia lata]|uniref:LysE family translocator n=1 Tax=Burkholderia lata (strain ATCC 17760 / DSM 23089 / LMG 22485 / NCIMB 9086 / R18194 / 383) TaxID=482957 RepID=UPI0014547004|nr:LysE family translocator [Burkholderia lata]VWC70375.1 LysE family protein [Burkholderia lata]
MLTLSPMLKMSFYAAIVLLVPGPTNTLLLSAGLKLNLRGACRLVAAEASGYVIAIAVWGFFLWSLAIEYPWIVGCVKLISSMFICYLAVKMWFKGGDLGAADSAPLGFRGLFVATLMNPKALLFSSAIFPESAFRSLDIFLLSTGVFLITLIPIGLIWSRSGRLLVMNRTEGRLVSTVLRCSSLVLLMFAATLASSVLSR